MAEKAIMTIKHNDRIDFNVAQDQLVDIALSIANGDLKINEESLPDILPAFFSYCSHIHESEGTVIDQIHYNSYIDIESSTAASAGRNNLNINPNHFKTLSNFRLAAEFFTSMFHETQHISDTYNKINQDQTNVSTQKAFFGSNHAYFMDYINHYKKANFFKISNPATLETNASLMNNFAYKNYYFDQGEIDARTREFNAALNLLEYAKTRPDIIADEKKFNQINGLIQEVSYIQHLNEVKENRIKDIELPENLREEFLEHMDIFYDETRQLIVQAIYHPDEPLDIDQETQKEYNKNNAGLDENTSSIEERLNYLTSSQNMFYDERRADQIGELILASCEHGLIEDHKMFAYLIKSSDFSPSEEQMDRIAKIYQTAHPEEGFPMNQSLSDFVESFNTYSQSYLLPLYAKNNPDFFAQVENYNSEIYPLDMEVVDKIEKDISMDTPNA